MLISIRNGYIFIISLIFTLYDTSIFTLNATDTTQLNQEKVHVVVAIAYKPGLPQEDPHWYTKEHPAYIESLLPEDKYEVSGYFVCFENILQFIEDMKALKAQKGKICVLNLCEGGESWDGYVGLSLNKYWEQDPEAVKIPLTGANYEFIYNSDDKTKLQANLAKANLRYLPQVLATKEMLEQGGDLSELLKSGGLESLWPLFCKLNIGSGAEGISEASVCENMDQLKAQIGFLHSKYTVSDIVIQPYLPGPEYTVLVLKDKVYAAIRRDFHNSRNIMLEEYLLGIRNVDEEISYLPATEQSHKVALDAIKAIPGKQHYSRIDMRDDGKGNLYVIDVNERPGIGHPSTVNCMLEFNHLTDAQLIRDIIDTCVSQ